MSQEAIGDADVSAEAAGLAAAEAAEEGQKSERELQLDEISRKRAEQIAEQNQQAVDAGLLPAPQEKPANADAIADAPLYKKDGKWVTKTKIDGKEQEVPWDTVLRTFQKNQAADVRLHQASETLREANVKAKQIVDQAVIDAKNRQGKQPSSSGDAADEDVTGIVERAFSELVEGSPKDGAKLLAQVLGRLKATPQSAAIDISGQVAAEVARLEEHRTLVSAVESFRKNHADLANDPVLHAMVDKESAVLQADPEFQGKSPGEILEASALRVKEKITAIASRQTPATTDRHQRKVAAAAPGPGTSARREAPKQPQPPTVAQKLAAMRAGRGQA